MNGNVKMQKVAKNSTAANDDNASGGRKDSNTKTSRKSSKSRSNSTQICHTTEVSDEPSVQLPTTITQANVAAVKPLGNPVDGRKRKKYKSKLWSDIVDEYEEDMRKAKIEHDNELQKQSVTLVDESKNPEEKTTISKNPGKNQIRQSTVNVALPVEESFCANNETKENSQENNDKKDKNKMTKLCDTPCILDIPINQSLTPITKTHNDVQKTNPPIKKDDKKVISIQVIDKKKLSTETIIVDKSKKESKITKDNSLEKECLSILTSYNVCNNSEETVICSKKLGKNSSEKCSSAMVDNSSIEASVTINARNENKYSVSDKPSVQIPATKTQANGGAVLVNPLGIPVEGRKRKKYKSKLWSDIVDEYEEDMRKSLTTHENVLEKDASISVDKGIKSKKTVSCSMTSTPKTETNVEALRINPPETEKLSVEPITVNKPKKESIIIEENSIERECFTSSDKCEKPVEKTTTLKILEKNTPKESSAIVDLRVNDANNSSKQNKCKGKNVQKDTTNMAQESENINYEKLCDNTASALDTTIIQTSIPEIKTSDKALETNSHLKKDDKKEISKHEIENKKLSVDYKLTEKSKKESIITQVSVERKKKCCVNNEQISKNMKTQKLNDMTVLLDSPSIQTFTSTTGKSAETVQILSPVKNDDTKAVSIKEIGAKKSLVDCIIHIVKPKKELITTEESLLENQPPTEVVVQTKKSEETIIRPKTSILKADTGAEAVRIATPVREDNTKAVPKNKKVVKKTSEQSIISIDKQKIKSINIQEKLLKKHCISVDEKNISENTILVSKNLVDTSKQSTVTADIISPVESYKAKNAMKYNKNQENDDNMDKNTKILKPGGLTAVLESPITHLSTSTIGTCYETKQKVPSVIRDDAKEFPKNKIRVKKTLVDSIIHIVKPKKLITQYPTSELQAFKSEETVICSKTSTSTTDPKNEAVRIVPSVSLDSTKEVPKYENGAEKPLVEFIFPLRTQKIKSIMSPIKSLKNLSAISVDETKNSENTIFLSKNLETNTSEQCSAILDKSSVGQYVANNSTVKVIESSVKENKVIISDNEKDTNTMTRKSVKDHNEHTKLYDKKDIRNYFRVQTLTSNELRHSLCDKPIIESSLAIHENKENKSSVSDNQMDTIMQSQKSGDSSVILDSPIDQTNTKTTGISPEAVRIVPSVEQDETKELPKNEIFAKITTHKMSLENLCTTSVDMAHNSLETDKRTEDSIKENKIKENDNHKDMNTITQKSGTIRIKYTKVCDKTADSTDYLSIQTSTRRTQNNVDELRHNPLGKPIISLDLVNDKKVPIKTLPVCTAEPFTSVYKKNNGAITFLNQPLDDEFLASPDFLTVFSSCFPSQSK